MSCTSRHRRCCSVAATSGTTPRRSARHRCSNAVWLTLPLKMSTTATRGPLCSCTKYPICGKIIVNSQWTRAASHTHIPTLGRALYCALQIPPITKHFCTWPLYLRFLRSHLSCAGLLLKLSPECTEKRTEYLMLSDQLQQAAQCLAL